MVHHRNEYGHHYCLYTNALPPRQVLCRKVESGHFLGFIQFELAVCFAELEEQEIWHEATWERS